MTRKEFTPIFLGLIAQKIEEWTPEEATEEFMLSTMLANMKRHQDPIRELLLSKHDRKKISILIDDKPCRRSRPR